MTRVDWAQHARRLREHAAADAERCTADTGEAHTPDPTIMRIATLCAATAVLCPDQPNMLLEHLAARALAVRPAAHPHTDNLDLSSPGHRPDTPRP